MIYKRGHLHQISEVEERVDSDKESVWNQASNDTDYIPLNGAVVTASNLLEF